MEKLFRLLVGFSLALLAACTVQLAPDYDQDLVDGLDANNQQALVFFAGLEEGSTAAQFSEHEAGYANLIGGFDALRQRATSRYVPPLAARLSDVRIVREFCTSENDPQGCLNATTGSLGELLATLRQMRTTHRTSGLPPAAVTAFRNRYDIQIDQALTVENALRR